MFAIAAHRSLGDGKLGFQFGASVDWEKIHEEREAEPRTRPGASRSAAKHSCTDVGPWLA
jgi:hypothetical protein